MQRFLQAEMCGVEKIAESLMAYRVETTGLGHIGRGEMIHVHAITLVRGHTTRRGVGLGQISLSLERGHVVADGGCRHVDARHRCNVIGTNGLTRCHVMLNHPAENGDSAVVDTTCGHDRAFQATERGGARRAERGACRAARGACRAERYLPDTNL